MRKLSVYEFQRYVDTIEIEEILWSVNNECCNRELRPILAQVAFQLIRVSCNPNRICLNNIYGTVYIQDVKYIILNTAAIPTMTILDVVCGCYDESNDSHISLAIIENTKGRQ